MYGLHFREELDEPVAREFDAFIARLKGIILNEHNEDGSHKFDFSNLNDPSLVALLSAINAKGQHWKSGPWKLDDPASANPHKVGLRPATPTGTYNNYAPYGVDESIVIELEPDGGDVTLTGLKALDGANFKRIVMLRNRDSANSVNLLHENTGSYEAYRFDLPDGDDVELAPGQNVWLYYDPGRERWTAAITGQASGSIIMPGGAGSSAVQTATLTGITAADLNAATSFDIVAAQGSGRAIIPLQHFVHNNCSVSHSGTMTAVLRYSGDTTDILAANSSLGFSENRLYGISAGGGMTIPAPYSKVDNVKLIWTRQAGAVSGGTSNVAITVLYTVVSV